MQHQEIVLISTVHQEIGKCNSEELYKIIESINPDVIFLEEFKNNYTKYVYSGQYDPSFWDIDPPYNASDISKSVMTG